MNDLLQCYAVNAVSIPLLQNQSFFRSAVLPELRILFLSLEGL